jgi:hypothetical protein
MEKRKKGQPMSQQLEMQKKCEKTRPSNQKAIRIAQACLHPMQKEAKRALVRNRTSTL